MKNFEEENNNLKSKLIPIYEDLKLVNERFGVQLCAETTTHAYCEMSEEYQDGVITKNCKCLLCGGNAKFAFDTRNSDFNVAYQLYSDSIIKPGFSSLAPELNYQVLKMECEKHIKRNGLNNETGKQFTKEYKKHTGGNK